MFFAHSVPDDPERKGWEPLEQHLQEVADLAEKFTEPFDAKAFGRLVGLLHDAGKFRASFQDYLAGKSPSSPHAVVGATMMDQALEPGLAKMLGPLIGIPVSSHHAGLPGNGDRSFERRLANAKGIDDMAPWPIKNLPFPAIASIPKPLRDAKDGFGTAFFVRMLFSALCDADFLCTERFYNAEKTALRQGPQPSIQALSDAVDQYLARINSTAASEVIIARQQVLQACQAAATQTPGLFSLTVPTGGGKTLSSLSFALRHAAQHGLRRVIYVIPYTSIIEQTAGVFRAAFGPALQGAVIEHHSAALPTPSTEPMGPQRLRLVQENWDAPVIVTTSVQFFESLYSDRPARCRKLHNIADAVVVLDEVQALPTALLKPCVSVLARLLKGYGTTVLLCTATQPDLADSRLLGGELPPPREIMADPAGLWANLRRVQAEKAGSLSDLALLDRLRSHQQVLCIVDNRAHAAELYGALSEGEEDAQAVVHLSAGLCPADRRRILVEVKRRLSAGLAVRLVSTQVIEAGVDIDFPVVYRAVAGLDSLAQAAGRCNRNGILDRGQFVIFDCDRKLWLPDLERRRQLARPFLDEDGDPLEPERIARYFKALFGIEDLDAHKVMPLLSRSLAGADWDFHGASEAFQMIGDETVPLIVPTDETETLCAALITAERQGLPPGLATLRALQQVSVSVYRHAFAALDAAGAVARIGPNGAFYRLIDHDLYDRVRGLGGPRAAQSFDSNVI